jgi:DNA-binding CsgD family transcriptional regulator
MADYLSFHKNAHRKLEEVYTNIKAQLGVEAFGHHRFYKNANNEYYFFCSNRDLVTDYVLNIDSSKMLYNETLDMLTYNGTKYRFISWPIDPISNPGKIFYKNGIWHGLTAIHFNDEYTDAWWVAFDCDGAHLMERFSTVDFRKAFLLSIDYFEKFRRLTNTVPTGLILPRFKSFFEDNRDLITTNDPIALTNDLMESYYKNRTMFMVNDKIVSLSKGETDVLSALAMKGYNSQEIALARGVSVKTIENQFASIKRKTGMKLRSELFKLYHDQFGTLLQ